MLRSFRKQQWMAMAAMAGISTIGMQPIIAAGLEEREPASKPTWSVQMLDSRGKVVSTTPTRQTITPASSQPSKKLTRAEIEKLRHDLVGMKFSIDKKTAARAERMVKLFDAFTAKTAVERRIAVRELGVTTVELPADDGRDGTIKTFSPVENPAFGSSSRRVRFSRPPHPMWLTK